MNIESLREHCIDKPGVEESFPFGEDTLVFKVGGKIFLLTSLLNPISFNVKCNPEKAGLLREQHAEIIPGYHMNKKHWNTVYYNQNLPDLLLKELIDHSYELVFSSLPKTTQSNINVSNT
ncbi:MmcQ/YjbR family DNA-binding protein [Pedobacter arcticus]|uniref:MmcQ/YjbR family DNA-binding protein n=1 Tax=Pedobacter arcticus TaxID=752140 RepID=UPI0002D78492|nr:MmcQ/YjbR family DNA-binding protein [Pedobacter arcticus]